MFGVLTSIDLTPLPDHIWFSHGGPSFGQKILGETTASTTKARVTGILVADQTNFAHGNADANARAAI